MLKGMEGKKLKEIQDNNLNLPKEDFFRNKTKYTLSLISANA